MCYLNVNFEVLLLRILNELLVDSEIVVAVDLEGIVDTVDDSKLTWKLIIIHLFLIGIIVDFKVNFEADY